MTLLLAGLLLAQIAMAGPPAPYCESFVRLDETWPDGGAPASVSALVRATKDSSAYEAQLVKLENEGGPYADALAEPLADLARSHRGRGDVVQAQQAYQRALHIVRVNEGLYSKGQVPLLRELFETYRMSGDMEMLDARYDYFFRLYGSGQPPYSAVRTGATLEYLRWQREALRLGLDEEETRRLLNVYYLNKRILDAASEQSTLAFSDYKALVLSQLRNLYLIQYRYDVSAETFVPGATVGTPGVFDEKSASQHRLETLQRSALARGRDLLENLIARTPSTQPAELARAWLELADWGQWNDRREEAFVGYTKVSEILQSAGLAELSQDWLGRARELPDNGAFCQSKPLATAASPVIVTAQYDVSAKGRARDIEVTVANSEDQSKARKVRRKLAQIRFRPRFVNGVAQPELQMTRDYQVLN